MNKSHLLPSVFPYSWASDWGQDQYGFWQAFTYKNIRHAFRWIPLGSFLMGSSSGTVDDLRAGDPVGGELSRNDNEDRHQVTIQSGFWLGETTVTQALWGEVMNKNLSKFQGESWPVDSISWNDADFFMEKLSSFHPELAVRFPREAEWEYACKAWTQGMFNFDDKEKLSLQHANYSGEWNSEALTENAKKQTTKVKSHPCNHWGLYEMHGNVWEWCEDLWEEHLTAQMVPASSGRRKVMENSGMKYVVRGGSWKSPGKDLRSASRRAYDGNFRADYIGLRLALS